MYNFSFHKKGIFYPTKEGIYIRKYNKIFKWEDISLINGFHKWIGTSDLIVIEIIFKDGSTIVFDDGYYNISYLMDEVLLKKLSNFDKNWYSNITSLYDNKKSTIYKKGEK